MRACHEGPGRNDLRVAIRTAGTLAAVCLCAGLAHAAQPPELIPFWDASDETATVTVDHGPGRRC